MYVDNIYPEYREVFSASWWSENNLLLMPILLFCFHFIFRIEAKRIIGVTVSSLPPQYLFSNDILLVIFMILWFNNSLIRWFNRQVHCGYKILLLGCGARGVQRICFPGDFSVEDLYFGMSKNWWWDGKLLASNFGHVVRKLLS